MHSLVKKRIHKSEMEEANDAKPSLPKERSCKQAKSELSQPDDSNVEANLSLRNQRYTLRTRSRCSPHPTMKLPLSGDTDSRRRVPSRNPSNSSLEAGEGDAISPPVHVNIGNGLRSSLSRTPKPLKLYKNCVVKFTNKPSSSSVTLFHSSMSEIQQASKPAIQAPSTNDDLQKPNPNKVAKIVPNLPDRPRPIVVGQSSSPPEHEQTQSMIIWKQSTNELMEISAPRSMQVVDVLDSLKHSHLMANGNEVVQANPPSPGREREAVLPDQCFNQDGLLILDEAMMALFNVRIESDGTALTIGPAENVG